MYWFIRLVAFCVVCSFVSCVEIIDEVNVNNNGTGDFHLTVNMSKSKTKLSSTMLLDSIRGHKVPSKEQVILFLNDLNEYLESSKGISQVKHTYNFDDFIFTLSFHFQRVENINEAIGNLQFKNGQRPDYLNLKYSFDPISGVFSRNYVLPSSASNEFNKLSTEDQSYFIDAFYTSIIRFDRTIINTSNKKSIVSPNGKAVMLKSNATNIFKGQTNLSSTIQLK